MNGTSIIIALIIVLILILIPVSIPTKAIGIAGALVMMGMGSIIMTAVVGGGEVINLEASYLQANRTFVNNLIIGTIMPVFNIIGLSSTPYVADYGVRDHVGLFSTYLKNMAGKH